MMIREKPGEDNSSALIEQYKLYVEMIDRISARRADPHMYYIFLLIAFLALLSIVIERNVLSTIQNVILLVIALLGLVLCYVWMTNIRSYLQLNSGKCEVFHETEEHLPFASYKRDWQLLAKGADKGKYTHLSHIELSMSYFLYLFFFLRLKWIPTYILVHTRLVISESTAQLLPEQEPSLRSFCAFLS